MTALRSLLDAHGGRRRWALGAMLAVGALLLCTVPGVGLTDDDDFYAPAGISYATWLGRAATFQPGAWTRPEIDRAFAPNHEHPPFAKYVMGVAEWVFTERLGVFNTMDGARAGVSLLAALLAYVVASLGFMLRGRLGAVTATACLFLLPRFFFHSQVATLDVPVASTVTVASYLAWRGRRSVPHAVMASVAFGAALLTKLNAPFLLVGIGLHWLMRGWRGFRPVDGKLELPSMPLALPAMALVGPVMFVALWPHLWFDTLPRLQAYVAFHLHHYPIYLYYLGTLYQTAIPPWHVPWVMFASVVPLTILALMGVGIATAARAAWREARAVPLLPVDDEDERESLRAWLLVQAFIAIGIVSFTGVPKYGGEKLFMPLFPLVAVLAADGGARVAAALRELFPSRPLVELAPLAVVALHGSLALWNATPFNLGYYGEAILGPRGAEAIGMENTYYDVADKRLMTWMNQNAPRDARIHFEPNHKEYARTYGWFARDGLLRKDLQMSDEGSADFVVLTHERRWATYPALYRRLHALPVAMEQSVDGVPLYTVYRRR